MRSETLHVRTGGRPVVHDLTRECHAFVSSYAGQADGLLQLFVPHATAGIAVLETGAGSDDDLLAALGDLLPADDRWRHRHGSPGHGRSHVMPALVPPYATVPVVDGQLQLGTWQSICLVDLNVDNAVRTVRLSLLRGCLLPLDVVRGELVVTVAGGIRVHERGGQPRDLVQQPVL